MTEPTYLLTEAQQNEILHALMDEGGQNKAIAMLQSLPEVQPTVTQSEPVVCPKLTSQEQTAFNRFLETCEDGEGYDVPKSMIQRLAQIGVVRHLSRGIYSITEFGQSVVEPSPQLTPITEADITNEMVLEFHNSFGGWDKPTHAQRIVAAYNAVIKHRSEAK